MIKQYFRLLLFCAVLVQLLSCMSSPPYEIKSPCVAADVDGAEGSLAINPCIRKPLRPVV